jgi:hypothetical protein
MSLTKMAGPEAGSLSQRYGSANLDPYQNVTDPQQVLHRYRYLNKKNCGYQTLNCRLQLT